ncbi:MAG: hypothetical protein EZS28_010778 [Streblomastix strix]|uniref:Uncharacterized protein n=1 Tax=Streblomastix strix TaxID=222440 RepID=A0A5J4WFA8_9EUKA|nr:MAG: hypothetical protein EZS28_010778 [Streblomastix strix]
MTNLIRNLDLATTLPNLHRISTSNVPNQDTEKIRNRNIQLRRLSTYLTLEQRIITREDSNIEENFGSIWVDIWQGEMRNRTKTTDQLPKLFIQYEKNRITERQVPIKIKYLISIICKLNVLRVQTRVLKNKDWKENIILPKEILQELYWWQGVIVKNQEMTPEVRILEAVMVSEAFPKGCGVTLELQTGDNLVRHGEWNKKQRLWTSNKKEIEAIYFGQIRYGQIFKDLLIISILIKIDSSISVQDIAKQIFGETLVEKLKKIVISVLIVM